MARIESLESTVAARIAAGEVIERPASVARELLDNAIDSGANEITLEIKDGGITYLSVADNGCGIEKDDLPLTAEPHATSKIKSLDDLYSLSTLGFRGEALYSIAAVSDFTVSSSYQGREAYTYSVSNGRKGTVRKGGPDEGTIVTSENLFSEIPARKAFLKRPSSEAVLIKNTLLSKAMAYPGIHFKMIQDGAIRIDLPSRKNKAERTLDIATDEESIPRSDFITLERKWPDFSLYLVLGLPSIHRSDRSKIRIYVNNRPVDEFSLVQAVCYGYGEKLPGGSYPYAFVFLEEKSELVDFNIHPAKREVKIRNKAEVHHAISSFISSSLPLTIPAVKASNEPVAAAMTKTLFSSMPKHDEAPWPSVASSPEPRHFGGSTSSQVRIQDERPKDNSWLKKAKEIAEARNFEKSSYSKEESWEPQEEDSGFRYIGQAFKLFLIAEKDGQLFLVDQHAAHERVLYDEIRKGESIQKLLIPIDFEVEKDVDAFLYEHANVYTSLGINISQKEVCLWTLSSIPAVARPIEKEIISLIKESIGTESEIESKVFAIIACKAAIKAGDEIDKYSAEALLEKTFKLENPTCPHGRTFVVALKEEELRKMVGRT